MAHLARAAMLNVAPGEEEETKEDSLLKNKLPVGRSTVSSFSENAPSLLLVVGAVVVAVAPSSMAALLVVVLSWLGGEWTLRKNSPYCSFCTENNHVRQLVSSDHC